MRLSLMRACAILDKCCVPRSAGRTYRIFGVLGTGHRILIDRTIFYPIFLIFQLFCASDQCLGHEIRSISVCKAEIIGRSLSSRGEKRWKIFGYLSRSSHGTNLHDKSPSKYNPNRDCQVEAELSPKAISTDNFYLLDKCEINLCGFEGVIVRGNYLKDVIYVIPPYHFDESTNYKFVIYKIWSINRD